MPYAVTVHYNSTGLQQHAKTTGGFDTLEAALEAMPKDDETVKSVHIIDTMTGLEVDPSAKPAEPETATVEEKDLFNPVLESSEPTKDTSKSK